MTIWPQLQVVTRASTAAVLAGTVTAALPLPSAAQDETHGIQEFTESTTWRVPPGVTHIIVELWGAGGGGAGGGASTVAAGASVPGGGGGGSGAYVRASLGVRPGEIYTIRIGAGGAGGRGQTGDGAQPGAGGEDTAFVGDGNVLLVAKGGRGGGAPRRNHVKGGVAGDGGAVDPNGGRLVRPGNEGGAGHEGGFPQSYSTSGGNGGLDDLSVQTAELVPDYRGGPPERDST
jgi:hypothetical protein